MDQVIGEVVEVLRRGGIVLYPTDTVWGLGCDATNSQAVEKIFTLKHRSDSMAMITLVDSLDNVGRYVQKIPDAAVQLFEVTDKPLTIIMPGGVGVAENLLPADKSIAIRVPQQNDFCRTLLRKFRRPLVSTSANISGSAAPVDFDQISEEIKGGVDIVVDPQYQRGATGKPSSIIKVGLGGEIQIIR